MEALSNLQLEAEFLGDIMADNRLIDMVCDKVSSDDFAWPHHSRIYEAIMGQHSLGKPANPVTLKPFFDGDADKEAFGGAGYLAQLTGVITLTDASHSSAMIADLARRRAIAEGLSDALDACADMNAREIDIVSLVDSAFEKSGDLSIEELTGAQCIDAMLDMQSQDIAGVSSKIECLNDLMGPLNPKQLLVMAGRPGMGKTAAALSYALGAAQNGHGVLFVSLEMSGAELAARMVSDLCYDQDVDLPFNAIRDNRMSADQRKWLGEAREFADTLPLHVIDAGSLTMSRLESLVRKKARKMAAQGQKLELVVVDYMQLLRPERAGKSKYEHISDVSMGLKALAKDHGVSVMALAQLSRNVEQREDKRPMLSDLRDSGQIEQDADMVLFLLREEYYLQQIELHPTDKNYEDWQVSLAESRDKIEFILAKRRNGRTGSRVGSFFAAYQAVRGAQ